MWAWIKDLLFYWDTGKTEYTHFEVNYEWKQNDTEQINEILGDE